MTALIDSSAWIEFIRGTGSKQNKQVKTLIRQSQGATTDAVMLEVVGGGRSEVEATNLTRLLLLTDYLAQDPRDDVLSAAAIYRRCRSAGETIRSMNDCLIAAVAIRHGVEVLHRDRDFEVIARHTPLRVLT